MLHKTKLPYTRLFAFLLAVFIAIGALFSSVTPVHAADGTIDFHAGPSIAYGDYFTSRMTFDGSNTAYCVEPLKHNAPAARPRRVEHILIIYWKKLPLFVKLFTT